MSWNRRQVLKLGLRSAAAGVLMSTPSALAGPNPAIKAVAFDAFPIFDPRPVFALVEGLFPGRGAELSNEWRTRQFEYTWQRALAKQYEDFAKVTEDALVYAAKRLKLELTRDHRDRLMRAYLELKAWPDVLPALERLKARGIRLGFLSNFTPKMLEANVKSAGLGGRFEQVLSTDCARTYKPDPLAYQLGVDAFKLKREEILFAAFAGWDASGARWFGYPTFWVNRLNAPAEELGTTVDATGRTLADLADYLGA